MAWFLGIDGGGTRTTAWLADEAGAVLARATAGPSNPVKVGFAAAERELWRAARAALRKAGVAAGARQGVPLQALCAGIAGVDRPATHRPLMAWLRQHIPAKHYVLLTDAEIALRAGLGQSPGVLVISGSGSIAFARDDRGHLLRAGGWGVPFDDIGSGYDLGRKAIGAALRDFDGRGPRTRLQAKVCQALKLSQITQVVMRPLTPQGVANLFPVVLDAALRRDALARELLCEAGRDLAELPLALLRRLGWLGRLVPVICAGGVFRSSALVRRSFARHLHARAPNARVLQLRHPPVEGALALARESAQ